MSKYSYEEKSQVVLRVVQLTTFSNLFLLLIYT